MGCRKNNAATRGRDHQRRLSRGTLAWAPATTDSSSPKLRAVELYQSLLSFHRAAGNADAVNERAVDVQVNRLRRKIETDPANPLFVQTVRGIGYRLVVST